MEKMNKIVLIGRLTKNPTTKEFESSSITRFTLAVNRNYKGKGGENLTDFILIVAWNNLGQACQQHLIKGNLIAIEGSLETRTYQNDQQKTVWISEIIAKSIKFLEPKTKTKPVTQNF